MEEQQLQSQIIGERVKLPIKKGLKACCVILSIIGVIFAIIGIVTISANPEYTVLFIVFGILICSAGLLSFFAIRKQEKRSAIIGDKPTIKNNGDGSLTLYLINNTEKTINLSDIKSVKFAPRVTATFMVFLTRYVQQDDGTIIIKLNDQSKIKVHEVKDGMIVQNKLLLLVKQAKEN